MKILHLTLSKKPFEVMVTGEKKIEYREPSEWIMSRLRNKSYDAVKFTNGYGKDKPYFIARYYDWCKSGKEETKSYSNGLNVIIHDDTIKIYIGSIIQIGNINN